MTTIKASCPRCGELALAPSELEVRADGATRPRWSYGFCCPLCRQGVSKPLDARVVGVLTSSGVPVRHREHSAVDGPPLDYDDLLDFHLLLQRSDWFERVASADPPP